jgi:tetratricopeptide (TPR) repeat protein
MDNNQIDLQPAEATNKQASIWMKRGIALLNANTADKLAEAIGCFDKAIELRRALPLAANPMFPYGLAAGWMNRADALTRLGNSKNLAEALHSYDEALTLLRGLPLDANPLFHRRLAIAWQNRGLVLQRQNAPDEAKKSFEEAVAVLQGKRAVEISDHRQILAAVRLNHANILISQKKDSFAVEARTAAKETLPLVSETEEKDLSAAEIGFKARHILCQAIAKLLAGKNLEDSEIENLVAEATDAVDEGLALARKWERQGINQFRPLALELFRFGARVYQIYQPHFLNEFLLENFDPARSPDAFVGSSEMQAAALESLWRAFREVQRGGFKTLNTPEFSELLERLRELRVVEDRLAELRRHYSEQ